MTSVWNPVFLSDAVAGLVIPVANNEETPDRSANAASLTKSQFRKFVEQITEDNNSRFGLKCCGAGFRNTSKSKNGIIINPAVYKSQLASSIKAFKTYTRIPYVAKDPTDSINENSTSGVCCQARRRIKSAAVTRQPRPGQKPRIKSAPPTRKYHSKRPEKEFPKRLITYSNNLSIVAQNHVASEPGKNQSSLADNQLFIDIKQLSNRSSQEEQIEELNRESQAEEYDRLTPYRLQQLGAQLPEDCESVYGDRVSSEASTDEKESQKEEIETEEDQKNNSITIIDDKEDMQPIWRKIRSEDFNHKYSRQWTREKLKQFDRENPKFLKSERLDEFCLREGRKEKSRYDFDMSNVHVPVFYFAEVLPPELKGMNLRAASFSERSLTNILSRKGGCLEKDKAFVERTIELDKLVSQTRQWEEEKDKKIAQVNREKRQRSAKSKEQTRSKECCRDCLQIACGGSCAQKKRKSEICQTCRQKYCTGSCLGNTYSAFERNDAEKPLELGCLDSDTKMTNQQFRSDSNCDTCDSRAETRISQRRSSRHNSKLYNMNNTILGRAKSEYYTFSRGQQALKPVDLRLQVFPCTKVSLNLVEQFQRTDLSTNAISAREVKTLAAVSIGNNGKMLSSKSAEFEKPTNSRAKTASLVRGRSSCLDAVRVRSAQLVSRQNVSSQKNGSRQDSKKPVYSYTTLLK